MNKFSDDLYKGSNILFMLALLHVAQSRILEFPEFVTVLELRIRPLVGAVFEFAVF